MTIIRSVYIAWVGHVLNIKLRLNEYVILAVESSCENLKWELNVHIYKLQSW